MLHLIFRQVFLFCGLSCWVNMLLAQPPSVLNEGVWYRLAITQTGLYQLNGAFLQEQGIDLSTIQPDQIGIFGFGGGMLSQALSEPRYSDIPEHDILMLGGTDGQFQPEDQVIFYAQGPDQETYQRDGSGAYQLHYQKNLYVDTAYYFLTLSQGTNQRVSSRPTQAINGEPATTFNDHWIHENDEYNILEPGSGREWYGEIFSSGDRLNFPLTLPGIVAGSLLSVEVDALGRTTSASSLEVSLGQNLLGEVPLTPILGGTYTEKGKEASALFETTATTESEAISIRYRSSEGRGRAHLNRMIINFKRRLQLYGAQTRFRSLANTEQHLNGYRIAGDENILIWDVTDPIHPVKQEAKFISTAWQFGVPASGQLYEFIAFTPPQLPVPQWKGAEPVHTLPPARTPDLLIVTPPSLITAAERLAQLRRSHDQLEVTVVSTEALYRQYASGRKDITAIRNYVKDLYDSEPEKLKYLLLFGKASYDYKDRVEGNINLVPTYQSRNSVHPIYSYPSDDYYGFLENNEGYWEESFRGDHTLDIGVGRLPVKDLKEAEQVVDKLVHYAKSSHSLGNWRTFVTFLADDGDNDRYQKDSEQLAAQLDQGLQGLNNRKLYLDAFEQDQFPNQELAPAVNEAVEEVIEKGTLLFNYIGHGNEQRLADENVLNVGMISRWTNYDRLPFFVTATCEFGRYDDPKRISGAERLVLSPEGGAVGMVTTARPVFSNTNFLLNQAFYRYAFVREEGNFLRIGEIFQKTKNDALNGCDNRNFTLLADPSMRLAYPRYQITVDSILSINTGDVTDTVRALERVRIFGQIVGDHASEHLESFDGELTLVLHDKAREIQTRGNEGTTMQFKQTQNVINRVRARIEQGKFSVDLLVPQNINYQKEKGRISMYARDDNSVADAFGGLEGLYVGGSLPGVPLDNTGPRIQLFINDTTFQTGGICGTEPRLLAHFWDEQGINLSEEQLGHEIVAELTRLDNDGAVRSFQLNDFYRPQLNDYRKGSLHYPLGSLEEGNYMLTLYAWDSHNNVSEGSIKFRVTGDDQLIIENLANYPNPFDRVTSFILEHNRAGEDLSVLMTLYDMMGDQVFQLDDTFPNAAGRLTILNWRVGYTLTESLSPGMYIFNVVVKSDIDRQEVSANLKIFVTNSLYSK
jgi:hypothetical protein